MKLKWLREGPRGGWKRSGAAAAAGTFSLAIFLPMSLVVRGDAALDKAAEELAELGRTTLNGPARPAPVAVTPTPAAGVMAPGTPVAVAPETRPKPVEAAFIAGFAGTLEDGAEVLAKFTGDKVEWVGPLRRGKKESRSLAFTLSEGRISVLRPESVPLVYQLSTDRNELTWVSGEDSKCPKKLVRQSP